MLRFERTEFAWSLLIAMGFLCLGAAPASAQNWAEKMFKDQSHDFRIVGRGTKSEYHFEFTNLYEEDVHVSAVRTSCGCTTPTVTKETVKTHETSAVVATFNTSTFIGQKSATLTVVFDRPTYAEVQLKVSGFIRTDITFDPPEVSFGELGSGETSEREVVITHTGNSNWEIVDVRSHCGNLTARLDPVQRTPGMVRYRMLVKLDDKMPEGDIRERLTLISNDQSFPTTEMAISGRIQPTVSVFPASVSLGTTSPEGSVEKKLVIRGKEPFEVADVLCADERFEFVVPIGRKKVHFVKMRFKGDGTDRSISQEVRIITDLEGDKSASCVVTGTVR
jgi:hypothetical protein